jgi:hypothetical protein
VHQPAPAKRKADEQLSDQAPQSKRLREVTGALRSMTAKDDATTQPEERGEQKATAELTELATGTSEDQADSLTAEPAAEASSMKEEADVREEARAQGSASFMQIDVSAPAPCTRRSQRLSIATPPPDSTSKAGSDAEDSQAGAVVRRSARVSRVASPPAAIKQLKRENTSSTSIVKQERTGSRRQTLKIEPASSESKPSVQRVYLQAKPLRDAEPIWWSETSEKEKLRTVHVAGKLQTMIPCLEVVQTGLCDGAPVLIAPDCCDAQTIRAALNERALEPSQYKITHVMDLGCGNNNGIERPNPQDGSSVASEIGKNQQWADNPANFSLDEVDQDWMSLAGAEGLSHKHGGMPKEFTQRSYFKDVSERLGFIDKAADDSNITSPLFFPALDAASISGAQTWRGRAD